MFNHYASTDEPSAKKVRIPPLKVNISPLDAFDSLLNYLKENNYEQITVKEEYYDLFAVKEEFEISFLIAVNDGASLIQISVYSDKKLARVKKKLKEIYIEIEERFERYL